MFKSYRCKKRIGKTRLVIFVTHFICRLSKIAGAKLTDGNPSITNLSDPNRPMKLGDKFSELYDNEWTDLLDHFIKKMKGKEDQVIQNIFYILQVY